jgi:hypothetical protein
MDEIAIDIVELETLAARLESGFEPLKTMIAMVTNTSFR